MNPKQNTYRKNYFLVLAFAIVLTISGVVAIFLANNLIVKRVESDFNARKVEVLEHNLLSFNEFFNNKIPEISFYQGYLDSATASVLAENILKQYPFVEKIRFYDIILNPEVRSQYGLSVNNLMIYPTSVIEYWENQSPYTDGEKIMSVKLKHSPVVLDDFNTLAVKFGAFLEVADTTRSINESEVFNAFYSVTPGKVSYMNIPRRDDLKVYKDIIEEKPGIYTQYANDMFVFYIDPYGIQLENTLPELYQKIEIRPLVYDVVDRMPELWVTEAPLPGALADYKIYFSSSPEYLQKEIRQSLFPVLGGIVVLYLFLIMFAYLIYRNLYINSRMYKLQYDFINNLTHEFKTPVSVIKIAGNNIGNSKNLSDEERKLYSRILDQESDKLNNLMNTLLNYAQIENKVIKAKIENVDLESFIENIVKASKVKYADMNIEYHIDLENQPFMKTDPVLLSSVFNNLIDNAYKYSNLDSKFLKINTTIKKKYFYFTFQDKGIGIEKKELKNVFKKFYRVQTRFNQQGSVGLGLAFCKEIINFMGGEIQVESEIGVGTTFHVYLPIQ